MNKKTSLLSKLKKNIVDKTATSIQKPSLTPAPAKTIVVSPVSVSDKLELAKMGEQHREETFKKLKEIWIGFLNLFRKPPISDLFRHLAKWIVFLFVLYVVFVGFKAGRKSVGGSSSSNSAKYETAQKPSFLQQAKASIFSGIESVSQVSSIMGQKASVGVPRENEDAGRCNDVEWVSMGGSLNSKSVDLCFKSSVEKPAPIRWVIDPTNLYEYDTLPKAFKDKIRSDKTKLLITIPYVQKGASYVLSCKNAVYEDGSAAGDLFADETNNYCKLNTKTLNTEYKYTPLNRPLKSSGNYKGLDVYQ